MLGTVPPSISARLPCETSTSGVSCDGGHSKIIPCERALLARQLLTIIRQAGSPRHNNDHRPASRRLLYRKTLCYETRNLKLYIGHKSGQGTYPRGSTPRA